MGHINIKTGKIEFPYIDKIYITEDKSSYISLNTGIVVYLENNQLKNYQFDMGRNPYKMLSYLMENNGDFVPSDTLYYDVFGQNKTEKQDAVVDEVRRTLCKIACIKNSDLKIKKHSGGETAFTGYTLMLPEQEIDRCYSSQVKLDNKYKYIEPVSGRNFCERIHLEKKISDTLKKDRIVFLSGLSGTGKSEIARAYGMHSNYTYILPLKLNEDGTGDFRSLVKQVKNSLGEEITPSTLVSSIEGEKVLIILDNYNSESEIIFEVRETFGECDVLVTSQISTETMRSFGPIIQIGEKCSQDSEWIEDIFIKYADLDALSEKDKKCICEIGEIVGYHTMLLCQIALQHKRSGESLENILLSIRKGINSYVRTKSDIKTSMLKDGHLLSKISPYELLKTLFANNIMTRRFTDTERQVLGAIIRTENFINNIDFICELVGDNSSLECKKARNAMIDLQEDHIVEIYNDSISLHPLIRALVIDDSIFNDQHTIADISYEYLVHILCNKLVEEVTLNNYKISNYVWGRKYPTYFSWVLDYVHSAIIPHMIQQEELPVNICNEYTYFIISAQNDSGGKALYISFDEEVICLLDASRQCEKQHRYFSCDNQIENINKACNCGVIIECNCCNSESTIVIPGKVGDICITSIGRYVFESKKIPENVFIENGIEEIRDYCFLNTSGMNTIHFPDSLIYIGLRAFEFSKDLRTIHWGAGLRKLKQSSFANCNNLCGTLKLPDRIDEIQRYSFMNIGIEELILPEHLTDIGRSCFYDCTALKKVTFGKNLSEIRYQLLFGCDGLERVIIPGNIKVIHEEAFGRCITLKEVIIEEGVERINNCAFIHCTELVDVWFPQSIVSIAKGIFAECPKVVAHVFEGSSVAKQLERYRVELGKKIQIEYR